MKKTVRILFAVLLVGVVSEFGLRLGAGLGNPVVYETNPTYGYMPAPNQNTRRFGSHIFINHAGMRSPEFTDRRPSGLHRILFVGDSVTFGPSFVDQSKIFSTLIPGDLQKSGLGMWETLNASAPGWATGNEVGFLKARGSFDANVVVLVINTGDLEQPFAKIDGTGSYPTKRPPSAIWELLTRYALPRIGLLPGQQKDPGSTGDAAYAIPVSDALANIAEFRRITERSGAKFILLYMPAAGRAWLAPHWSKSKAELDKWSQENGVIMVDMSRPLDSLPAQQIYFDGIHLREVAHQISANQLVPAISRSESRGVAGTAKTLVNNN